MLISQGNWTFLVQDVNTDEVKFYAEIGEDFSCSIKLSTLEFSSLPTIVAEAFARFMHRKCVERRTVIENFQIRLPLNGENDKVKS